MWGFVTLVWWTKQLMFLKSEVFKSLQFSFENLRLADLLWFNTYRIHDWAVLMIKVALIHVQLSQIYAVLLKSKSTLLDHSEIPLTSYFILLNYRIQCQIQETRSQNRVPKHYEFITCYYTQDSDQLIIKESWCQIRVNGFQGGLDLGLLHGCSDSKLMLYLTPPLGSASSPTSRDI